MEPKFIHLRVHTEFSLSEGLLQLPSLMQKTAAMRMPAIAITDLGNLYAVIKFYQEAFRTGIKPIIGVDLGITNPAKTSLPYRLTLLCQTDEGYKNLLKLISKSYLEGQADGTPLIQKEWLTSHAMGLIALSGGQEGDIGQALMANQLEEAKKYCEDWQSLFPHRFYIEISRVGKSDENDYIQHVLPLAESLAIPVVATNKVCFLERDDFEAHEARVCIQEGITLNDPHRLRHYTDQQYLRSQEEMQALFADMPAALENTVEIAKRCNVTFTLGKNRLPHFPVPEGSTTEDYLTEIAKQGLHKRLQTLFTAADISTKQTVYEQRLERELKVINDMGFAGYFLIVADFTKWAKENDIPVGPGRGSGPGSLVAYALHITDLDPIALDLLFERFLNPERVTM
ncbi:MAG: DNA polymerase III subunit alpha, partial [Gammaproteobacteria bacterium]|nr:DNA polymerase III subunit alpha [Gammaproteobacteria bacterium]